MKVKLTRNGLNATLEGIVEAAQGMHGGCGVKVSKKYQYGMAKNLRIIEKEVEKTRKGLKALLDAHDKLTKSLATRDDKGEFVVIEHAENKETGAKAYKEFTFTAENRAKYEASRDATQEAVNSFLNDEIEIEIHSIKKEDIPAEAMPFDVLKNLLDLIDPASDDKEEEEAEPPFEMIGGVDDKL